MARASKRVWRKRVDRWKRSGETAAQFAARIGVNPYTLKWWKWSLGTEGTRRTTAATTVEAAPFVELVRGNRAAAQDGRAGPSLGGSGGGFDLPDDRVEVRLHGGIRIFLPPRFDGPAIADLVAVLGRR